MSEPALKRKRPPTFQHLPVNRAKKLKQAWVDNKKIKSKWNALKRREALNAAPEEVPEENEEDDDDGSTLESQRGETEDEATTEPEPKQAPKKSTLHPSRSHIHPELAPQPKRRKIANVEPAPEAVSLRELSRKAYSRESLHTFKSGGGQKRETHNRGQGRGRGRGRAGPGVVGRGQPNMKLRMGAMLEKIKQSMA